ncbi:MAG: carbohydrate kinase family protein [Deltaproteobacteria bacterium]|nr:carbohydrate kinase family protein [Deltaproteobacteria bacterium]
MADVYCFGHVSTGKIIRLKGRYPEPDGYSEIVEILDNHSGEATGSALVLAQLGISVTLEGNWIGDNHECRRTLDFLQSRGLDCSGLKVQPGYQGVTELVISDGETRTVFGRYIDLLFTTRQWEMPNIDKIRAAKIACIDPSFGEATLIVARTAHHAARSVVTCDTRADSELATLSDIIAISQEFLRREYPDAMHSDTIREQLFYKYLEQCPGLVVFTSGKKPLWYGRGYKSNTNIEHHIAPGKRCEMPSFKIEVVDSAGAGDSFRGGLIYGLLSNFSDEDNIRFSCAVAALICTTSPGCVHPPSLSQVQEFLAAHQLRS